MYTHMVRTYVWMDEVGTLPEPDWYRPECVCPSRDEGDRERVDVSEYQMMSMDRWFAADGYSMWMYCERD